MRELPILFQTEMVQAILAGRKTMTRRLLKNDKEVKNALFGYTAFTPDRHISVRGLHKNGEYGESFVKCPYGKAGDVLWVREAFNRFFEGGPENYVYKATWKAQNGDMKWKPSIHMPKEAARIWLKVVSVKGERAQDISEEDALREGIMQCTKDGNLYKYGLELWRWQDWHKTAKEAFKHLWVLINGQESWDANPWVWVIEYEILSTTGKPNF